MSPTLLTLPANLFPPAPPLGLGLCVDWNWYRVRAGTYHGLAQVGARVVWSKEVCSSHTLLHRSAPAVHNTTPNLAQHSTTSHMNTTHSITPHCTAPQCTAPQRTVCRPHITQHPPHRTAPQQYTPPHRAAHSTVPHRTANRPVPQYQTSNIGISHINATIHHTSPHRSVSTTHDCISPSLHGRRTLKHVMVRAA